MSVQSLDNRRRRLVNITLIPASGSDISRWNRRPPAEAGSRSAGLAFRRRRRFDTRLRDARMVRC